MLTRSCRSRKCVASWGRQQNVCRDHVAEFAYHSWGKIDSPRVSFRVERRVLGIVMYLRLPLYCGFEAWTILYTSGELGETPERGNPRDWTWHEYCTNEKSVIKLPWIKCASVQEPSDCVRKLQLLMLLWLPLCLKYTELIELNAKTWAFWRLYRNIPFKWNPLLPLVSEWSFDQFDYNLDIEPLKSKTTVTKKYLSSLTAAFHALR